MKNGWTGAQYSFLRVLVGLYLAGGLAWLLAIGGAAHRPELMVRCVPGLIASVAFALGFKDRIAAVVVAALLWRFLPIVLPALLLVHAIAVPAAPFGSWEARGRLDPGGGWRLPWAAQMCFRVVAVGAWLWAFAIFQRGGLAPVQIADVVVVALIASAFAFDPAWIRPRDWREPSLVLYDGECGFCHAWVRALLAEDGDGRCFRFAPLQAERAQGALTAEQRTAAGDTVIVIAPDGRVLNRSEAAIHIGDRLGGLWRAATFVLGLTPRAWRDATYDQVARVRHHLARPPKDACPILPKPLRERFEA